MTSTEPQPLSRLRTLLHDVSQPAAERIAGLAAEREQLTAGGELGAEQLAIELRWLERRPEARGPAAARDLLALQRDWLAMRVRGLAADRSGDPAVLFDLADAAADAVCAGEPELVRLCTDAIARGATASNRGPLLEEATERVAALLASVEDPSLRHQVEVLRHHADLLAKLAVSTGEPAFRRFAQRLRRAADDRELARRLEGLLGRAGVVALETTNFVLLLLVLVILAVESTVALTPGQTELLHWIDAVACSFFVVDFFFELSLHPRRLSWFLRNALTDLAPAIPSVLFLLPGAGLPGAAGDVVVLRLVRLLRVTWAARYVQALRPLLRSARLLLFLVRGLDGLVQRFAQLLNREFVFVPAAAEVRRRVVEEDRRDLVFEALRREHELVELLAAPVRTEVVRDRIAAAGARLRILQPVRSPRLWSGAAERDVPIEQAIEQLWALRPQDLGRWLRPSDIRALDRVLRIVAAVPVRWLPLVRSFVVHPLPGSAEERVVGFARRIAEWLEAWHNRLLFYADLHGIVTGPQILDRVASAMVKATQRPAVRLLLIGGVLSLFNVTKVSVPVLVFGAICLGLLSLGLWLKRLAGEAADAYRLTSEAHFLSQLDLGKLRYEAVDLPFLAQRVFGDSGPSLRTLQAQLRGSRAGVPAPHADATSARCLEASRVALLYLHFLDGAPLHISDVKTTEQLLASQSLENLRTQFLRFGKRERKRLRRLKLDDGTVWSGPYLWFAFIAESIAVETAKRIDGYNRFCVPLAERGQATPAQIDAMADWLQRRADPKGGRTIDGRGPRSAGRPAALATTEFTALDFVGADPERDRHLASLFGDDVLAVVVADRRTMVREIFGTRPVHRLPKHERSFNPLRFYQRRLSHGRVLLAPLLLLWRFVASIGWLIARIRQIVREVFDPELAMQRREVGAAPFGVALRKIHRMKAPGLLEAVAMRIALDPAYSGAPPGWSSPPPVVETSDLERDLAFLHLHERQRAGLREAAADVHRAVASLHEALARLPVFPPATGGEARDASELAVTSAWIADKDDVRALLFAERWRIEVLPGLLAAGVPGSRFADLWRALRSLFAVSTVDRWLQAHGRDLAPSARRVLHRAYARDLHGMRRVLTAWAKLPPGSSPADTAIARLRAVHRSGPAVRRDLLTLRAVQSLAVLDIRNYRDLVFRLGGYEQDGEDPRLGTALP